MNVLVLCHANRWRSPLAAVILKHHGPSTLTVKSAGFKEADKRAAKPIRDAAAARGYDLEAHRSQLATRELLFWADLVVYMDGGNYKRLASLLNGSFPSVDVACLGQWAKPPVNRVPDPAFMAKASQEFADTVDLIEEAARNLGQELIG